MSGWLCIVYCSLHMSSCSNIGFFSPLPFIRLCLPYMMREMKSLTEGHIVAELMLIFAFAYMIEGASGFGTPVALGAPMLASLGHCKFGSVVTLLVMNTFATVWGAVGKNKVVASDCVSLMSAFKYNLISTMWCCYLRNTHLVWFRQSGFGGRRVR